MTIVEESTFVDAAELAALGIELERNVALAPFTTMKIGGAADLFTRVVSLDQLQALVGWAHTVELPYFLLGGGSNMLISDAGIRGLVLYNCCRRVELMSDVPACGDGTNAADHPAYNAVLYAESGAAVAGAARQTVQRGYEGLEWAVSLPGTVGGAVVGNAGAYGGEVKDTLVQTRMVMTDGSVAILDANNMDYAYRSSTLKRQRPLTAGYWPVVLDARFGLDAGDADVLRQRSDEYLAHRRRTQPVEPSLGSTFMNPPGDHAGRLIEAAGLKDARVGGVSVSQTHANFLVNPGGVGSARASDVLELVQMIQDRVRSEFGVDLVPEIQVAGE